MSTYRFAVALPFHGQRQTLLGLFLEEQIAKPNRDYVLRLVRGRIRKVTVCGKNLIVRENDSSALDTLVPIPFKGADTVDIEGEGTAEVEIEVNPERSKVVLAWGAYSSYFRGAGA